MCQLLERRNNGNEIEPVHFVPVLFYTFCTFRTGSILHATFLKNGTKKPGPKCPILRLKKESGKNKPDSFLYKSFICMISLV